MKHSITLRRVLVTFSLLLTFIFGAPTVAKAADLPTAGHLTFTLCPGSAAIVFYGPSATAPAAGNAATLVTQVTGSTAWPASATISIGFSACSTGSGQLNTMPTSGTVTSQLLALLESNSSYESRRGLSYSGLGIVNGSTQYTFITINSTPSLNAVGAYVVNYGAGGSGGSGGSAPQITPMVPTDKPTVSVTSTTISCTLGTYSQLPTSAAFSLFVDGKHVATNFSKLGDYLPNWITPWASAESISRTATLTGAEWELKDSYKGKSIACATLAYSQNAIGLTQSAPYLVAK